MVEKYDKQDRTIIGISKMKILKKFFFKNARDFLVRKMDELR